MRVATDELALGAVSQRLHKGLGDLAGMIVVAPLVALSLRRGTDRMLVREPLWLDGVVFLLTLAAVIALLFSVELADGRATPVSAVRSADRARDAPRIRRCRVRRSDRTGRDRDVAVARGSYGRRRSVLPDAHDRARRDDARSWAPSQANAGARSSELARRSAELRAQQQALADAMRVSAASETAATLAHEMSQPLSAIGTYAHAICEMVRQGGIERPPI